MIRKTIPKQENELKNKHLHTHEQANVKIVITLGSRICTRIINLPYRERERPKWSPRNTPHRKRNDEGKRSQSFGPEVDFITRPEHGQ